MKFNVRHVTTYHYSVPVSHSVNQLCLLPRNTPTQQVLSSHVSVAPNPERITQRVDSFGNTLSDFNLENPHQRCVIESVSLVETPDDLAPMPTSPAVNTVRQYLSTHFDPDALLANQCLLPSQHVSRIEGASELIESLAEKHSTVLGFAEALMRWIFNEFDYDPSFSTVVTPAQVAWQARKGVCQDYAHIGIAILREAGIPARYVSGYLETLPPPGQKKLQGSDASHAWYSVYSPGGGWFDFDPTNNKRADAQYITTAWGRDYGDVAPLKGVVYGGGQHKVSIAVDVERVNGALYALPKESA